MVDIVNRCGFSCCFLAVERFSVFVRHNDVYYREIGVCINDEFDVLSFWEAAFSVDISKLVVAEILIHLAVDRILHTGVFRFDGEKAAFVDDIHFDPISAWIIGICGVRADEKLRLHGKLIETGFFHRDRD